LPELLKNLNLPTKEKWRYVIWHKGIQHNTSQNATLQNQKDFIHETRLNSMGNNEAWHFDFEHIETDYANTLSLF
jgi:hypothetical protein